MTISKVATATALTADKASAGYGSVVNHGDRHSGHGDRDGDFPGRATTLGTGTLDSLGKATFATSALSVGKHTLTAAYGGDANDASSTSAPITVKINAIFTTTGSMAQPRSDHTATLLNDGRVLVAGGFDLYGASTATSEVYCPVSMAAPTASLCQNGVGRFSTIGTLPSKSTGHTATLLANEGFSRRRRKFERGTVHRRPTAGSRRAGSRPCGRTTRPRGSRTATSCSPAVRATGSTLNSTIIYNAATGTFYSGPNMTAARERHAATLLPSGKVLITGRVRAER